MSSRLLRIRELFAGFGVYVSVGEIAEQKPKAEGWPGDKFAALTAIGTDGLMGYAHVHSGYLLGRAEPPRCLPPLGPSQSARGAKLIHHPYSNGLPSSRLPKRAPKTPLL